MLHNGSRPKSTLRKDIRPQLPVLMPVFGAQRELARSLESLRHVGAGFKVFVVDGGSEPPLVAPEGLPFTTHMLRLTSNRDITRP